LPTSAVEDVGPMYVIRLQRVVLQEWKIKEPWAEPGQVTVANGGDVAKQAGVFPMKAVRPSAPPDTGWEEHLDQYTLDGKGTWYGPGFVGKPMKNGQIYDPNDPTTTAANAFPLGSQLKVTSKRTGKSVLVYVRDTGDFYYPRVVDLSPAAFALLGVSPAVGIQDVSVSLVAVPPVSSSTQAPPAR
ncbi:MAG TPA: septal ring lytic transglycosylase RlpA family protein, partial [Chloroflexota bacterium]|nr:septal ring lytic transglycosylase RlpA family protein [Chloroflexota bacterium]